MDSEKLDNVMSFLNEQKLDHTITSYQVEYPNQDGEIVLKLTMQIHQPVQRVNFEHVTVSAIFEEPAKDESLVEKLNKSLEMLE